MPMLALLLLASVQVSTTSITFSPMPAPQAVRYIAQATGRRLAVAPALAEEILFVRLKGAPVDTVLSRVADVLCAKWKTRADGITWLEPDPAAVRRIEKAEADEDASRLSDSFKYLRKRLAEQPQELDQKAVEAYIKKKRAQDQSISDAEARNDFTHRIVGSPASQESPAWRAVARIVLQMDPKVLLAMSKESREVWVENPTPMQHGFSDEAKEVLKTYRKELSILDLTLVAKRVKLIFRNYEIASAFNVNLVAYGLDGKPMDWAVARLNSYADLMKPSSAEQDGETPKPGEAFLQPSSDVIEARKAQETIYKGTERSAIFAKWRPRLLDPVHFEPTTWDIGEELLMAAESLNRNLVGTVNDQLIASEEFYTKVTATQVVERNRESFLPAADGWLVFRSHDRLQRTSRSKAKALLANCVRLGGLTVDLAADWAAQSTDRWSFMNWVGNYIARLGTDGGRYSDFSTTASDPDLLRLWSDIGSAGIESLRNGGVLQLSRLSPAAKAQVEEIVYWGELNDGRDPTDVLPNGIADGTLSMSIEETPVLYGWADTDGPPVAPRPVDAKEFGDLLANGQPYKQISAAVYRRYDRFRVGVHRKYKLNFLINPGAIPISMQLHESLFNPDSQDVSELPKDLKSAVEKSRLAALAAPPEVSPKRVIPPR